MVHVGKLLIERTAKWPSKIISFHLGVVQLNIQSSQSLHCKDLGGWVRRSQCARKDFKYLD